MTGGEGRLELRLGNTRAVLCADGTVCLPDERILLVADLHLGKGSSFRARRVPVPTGASAATLEKLSRALDRECPGSVIILGDLWHARDGCTPDVVAEFESWMSDYDEVEFKLVIGNHDRNSGLPRLAGLEMEDSVRFGDLVFQHEPGLSLDGAHVVAGHLHPGCVVQGRGRQSFRLPCFWSRPGVTVLPAFGEMTGLAPISPSEDDTVVALVQGTLLDVSVAVRANIVSSPR